MRSRCRCLSSLPLLAGFLACVITPPAQAHAGSTETLVHEGNRLYGKGHFFQAERIYDRALRADESSGEARYGKGIAALSAGRYQSALDDLSRTGGVDAITVGLFNEFTSEPDIEAALARFAPAFSRNTRPIEGTAVQTLKIAPPPIQGEYLSDPESLIEMRTRSLLREAKRIEDEGDTGEDAAAPGEPAAAGGQPQAADAVTLRERGKKLYSEGNREDAIRSWREALLEDPGGEEIRLYLAAAYRDLGDLEAAASEYTKIIEANPQNAKANANLGAIHFEQGQFGPAERELRTAISLAPRDAKSHNNLGGIYYKRGDLEKAAEELRRSLEIAPDDANTLNNLAGIYYKQENFDLAIEVLEQLLRLDPNFGLVHANLKDVRQRQRYVEESTAAGRLRAKHILLPTRSEAERALARVRGGERFEAVAAEMSVAENAGDGGDLGFFSEGELLPELEEAIRGLPRGGISDVVQSDQGFHVLYRVN